MLRPLGAERVAGGTAVLVAFGASSRLAADAFRDNLKNVINLTYVAQNAESAGMSAGAAIGARIAGLPTAQYLERAGGVARRDFSAESLPGLANPGIVWATYSIVVDDVTGVPVQGATSDQAVARAVGQGAVAVAQGLGRVGGDIASGLGEGVATGLGVPSWVLVVALVVALLLVATIVGFGVRKKIK